MIQWSSHSLSSGIQWFRKESQHLAQFPTTQQEPGAPWRDVGGVRKTSHVKRDPSSHLSAGEAFSYGYTMVCYVFPHLPGEGC